MRFGTVAAAFASLLPVALALNTGKENLDYNPAITAPTAGANWIAGQTYEVSWNVNLPSGVNSSEVAQTASLLLGYKENGSENLDYTLAQDVPLYTTGSYNVTLPSTLPYKATYIIALVGSSGDISPEFTIIPSSTGGVLDDILREKYVQKARRSLKLRL
ncbi:hypothetical protein P7C70_g3969, partial [Phenoliferia sp. Uapishka_3]